MTQGPENVVAPEQPVDAVDPGITHDAEDLAAEPVVATRTAERSGEQTAQSELDLGVVSTGSVQVDNALRPLELLGERPVADHAEAYEQVLADLTETMSDPAAVQERSDGEPTAPR